MALLGYLAVDNHGTSYQLANATAHPRGQLLRRLGRPKAKPAKVYLDTPQGAAHVGYCIGNQWFTIYEVHSWQGNKMLIAGVTKCK